jgi:hypothetical protein
MEGDNMPVSRFRITGVALCLMLCIQVQATESCPLAPAKVQSAGAAVARAAKAIDAYRIGKLKPHCMALVANRQKTGYLVDVREIHNDACGGDPMTEPLAFSIDVAWSGKMKSDAYDHLNYLPLACPKA